MRKSAKFTATDLQDFITRYNPLAIRCNGILLAYNYYGECYFEFMERFYRLFPIGYIDFVVLLVDHFGMDLQEASHEVAILIKRNYLSSETVLIVWQDNKEFTCFMRGVLQGISFITECPYKEDSFLLAKEKFFKINRDVAHE